MTPRTTLVTGAGGFVMSVFIARMLEHDPAMRVVAVDAAPPDALAAALFARFGERVDLVRGDVRDRAEIEAILCAARPDILVHGASVTHVPAWELSRAHDFIDVNAGGTMNVFEAARAVGTLRRAVQISSCAVYGGGTPDQADHAIRESDPAVPDTYYGIGKLGGEMIARRFGALSGVPVAVIRPTRVFGPMERPTSDRKLMNLPFMLVQALQTGQPVRISCRSRGVAGDWISAEDLAEALLRLLDTPAATGVYNIATGQPAVVEDLLDAIPAPVVWVKNPEEADFDQPVSTGSLGVYNTYALRRATGWSPRPLAKQLASYLAWAAAAPELFQTADDQSPSV
ncbi:NAD-dependent epimerase/dehydratase family protein [Amaricoccus tamworthensis]|uniref:NAD-dependent epimerase/dehydratase family protein n=1 Tax=Amaricoccus tamworthensis TaxID=57002 RepID=UPI003C7A062F